jgi:hypothetical protein
MRALKLKITRDLGSAGRRNPARAAGMRRRKKHN